MRRAGSAVGIAVVTMVVAAACTGDDEPIATAAVVTTTTEPPAERVDDGVLRLGALVPQTDGTVGASLAESLRSSVDAVNDAGGALGRPVELIIEDEGATGLTASQAIDSLVDAQVDAIIGPTSSNSAVSALDTAVAAGVLTCSATASAIALDGFPDNGLFFRTIATDSLQAVAIAEQAQTTGATEISIVHVDDAYGRPYAAAVNSALSFAEVTTIAIPVGDDDLTDNVDDLLTSQPRVVVIIGDGVAVAQFLDALAGRDTSGITRLIVNDAARSDAARPVIAGLPSNLRDRVLGVAPQIVISSRDNETPRPPFEPQVVDCVNLISLAAQQARSDSPSVIATQMSSVSDGGSACRSYAECVSKLDDELQINYNGLTGITDLARDGDPSRAWFDLFTFADDGADITDPESRFSVSST